MGRNQTLSAVQLANLNYIDFDSAPARDTAQVADCHKGTDVDQIIHRIADVHAHQSLTWLELTTCWRPFKQLADRERRSWNIQRVRNAVDLAEKMGLIEATDSIGSNYVLTRKGKNYTPSWKLDEMQASLL